MNIAKSQPKQNERRPFSRNRSLRTRLLITTITLVLIPVLITGIIAALISSQSLRDAVFDELESVATLKDAQIISWLESLQTNLDLIFVNQDSLESISTLIQDPSPEETSPAQVRSELIEYNQRSGYFTEIFVMDMEGRVILSTDANQEGKIMTTQSFFHDGVLGPNITPPIYELSLENYSIIVSQPLLNRAGRTIGVLAGRANLNTLNEIMVQRTGLGETGETYVINSNNAVLTNLLFQETIIGQTYINTQGATNVLEQQLNGSGVYEDYRDVTVVGVYHWIPELQIAVLAEQAENEALASVNRLFQITLGLIAITVLVAVIAAFLITQSITTPISKLAQAAEEVSRGNLDQNVEVTQQDEIGVLANSFNAMTAQLRNFIATLEQRVADRTKALSAVAEVSTVASTILDTNMLLQQVVDLSKERFDFYHAHIYLLDEAGNNLVLASGAGEPGRKMVAEGRTISLDREQSLVARAARERKGVTVNDVTLEPDFLPNPLLPDTRSELAVPMIVGDKVLGVFDVQSDVAGRFTDADINIQTTLASQVATAVQNATLYKQAETSAQDAQSLVDNAPEAIIIVDLETGLFTNPNENAVKLYGLAREDLVKVGPAQMSPPTQPDGRDSTEKAMEKIGEAMKGGTPVFEWMHRNGQGEDFLCEIRLVHLPGIHPRVRASVTDITERKYNEDLLKQRAQNQEALNLITQRIQSATTIETALQVAARELGHALGKRQTLVVLDPSATGDNGKEN